MSMDISLDGIDRGGLGRAEPAEEGRTSREGAPGRSSKQLHTRLPDQCLQVVQRA